MKYYFLIFSPAGINREKLERVLQQGCKVKKQYDGVVSFVLKKEQLI